MKKDSSANAPRKAKDRPGLMTTEFWTLVGGLVSGNAAAFSAEGDGAWYMKLAMVVLDVVGPLVYSVLRSRVKTAK